MKLTEILTPATHQRIINRYSAMMNGETPTKLNKPTIAKKIEWHVTEFEIKTGQLPE